MPMEFLLQGLSKAYRAEGFPCESIDSASIHISNITFTCFTMAQRLLVYVHAVIHHNPWILPCRVTG